MKFTLQQKSAGRTGLTTFNVLDEKNLVRGTVSVPSSASDDLIKCWKGTYVAAKPAGTAAMVAALRKGPKLSKEAILRGS
jgi:hypothetical protein